MAWLAFLVLAASAAPARPAGAGLYVVWANAAQQAAIDRLLPCYRGGQAVDDWSRVEPEPGRYNFARLDAALATLAQAGRWCTVQVNASDHPDYLYDRVPVLGRFVAGPLKANPRGHLQYWHPTYVQAYQALLRAFAAHFRASPHRAQIVGVRLNWNALSTEHLVVPVAFRQPDAWTPAPHGTPHPVAWTPAVAAAYRATILDAYVAAFGSAIRIFCRNSNLGDDPLGERIRGLLSTGQLGLFHTSTESEPRSASVAGQYEAFLTWCRSGRTVGYAEPWASSDGRHGGGQDPRTCSPVQWNYWMSLANLHCGVSCVAVYGVDLARATDPEYRAAFELVDRYAGHHASPSTTPGGWVALREGRFLPGDYTFLMRRTAGGTPVENVGPPDQRYGAWARRIAAGEALTFELDPALAASLDGRPSRLRVVYLDAGAGSLTISAGGWSTRVALHDTGRWCEGSWPLTAPRFAAGQPAVTIASDGEATLHWCEVARD